MYPNCLSIPTLRRFYDHHLSGKNISFPYLLSEFSPFLLTVSEHSINNILLHTNNELTLLTSMVGLVGSKQCLIETFSAPPGILLRVEGGSDFYIAPDGEAILRVDELQEDAGHDNNQPLSTLSDLDRDIILGPTLVLALAMRGTWSLHASAAMFQNQTFAFLGESGQGKSSLAAYLNSTNWHLVADDILPTTNDDEGVLTWPHFPQLKISLENQPGLNFPEQLHLDTIILLDEADLNVDPELQLLPPSQAIQVILSHTAGTRLFDPKLHKNHLDFCAGVVEQVPVYRLDYPHRKDSLPMVKDLLEDLC